MPSSEPSPSAAPSPSAEEKMSPWSRLGSRGGGRMGRPERMERATRYGTRKPSHPANEGEKDSGFSDGSSEYLSAIEQADAEEQAASPLPPWPAKPQKAMGGLLGSTVPVYLVKNVLLKQTPGTAPATPFLAWSSQRPLESAHGSAAHVLLIREPTASPKLLPPGLKLSARDTQFPVLGTYPRITPYPAEEVPSPAGDTSRHKHASVGEVWGLPDCPTTKDSQEKLQEEPPTCSRGATLLGPEAPACPILPTRPGLEPAEGWRATKRPGGNSLGRQRRLHNTVEILRKSGLLSITLRTKELLRQNSGTQRELAELREHAQLLCEAVRSKDSRVWARLQDAIDRSAAYWPIKGVSAQAHSGQQQQTLAAQPTSPLAPRPNTAQDAALPATLP